jgi:pyrroline-5-carboxylate reductase
MPFTHELAVLGAGNMAEAIVRGLLKADLLKPTQLIAADPSPQRRALFNELGVHATDSNVQASRDAATLLLSVKPQQMKQVLGDIAPALSPQTLIVSIAAGVSSGFIEAHLGGSQPWRIVRSMPNTPMLLGAGMAAIAGGRHATEEDLARVRRLFQATARILVLDESKMDAVTALSGSGPAYFFYLVEQMVAAGISLGLTPDEAHTLATQTALGAGIMLTRSSDAPPELRRKVTSPGGTTQAALEVMQSRGVGDAVVEAVRRAADRSRELGG